MGSETVKCCREWIVLPHWGNPKSVGLQYDYEPVVRLGPGEQYHCRYCGARFTLAEDGTVEVGPSVAELDARLEDEIRCREATETEAGECDMALERCNARVDELEANLVVAEDDVVEDGTVEVGPSAEKLMAALYREICLYGKCPGELQDFACPQEHEADKHGPCWLIYYGLADTYADAAELWKRMEEAAKSDG